jgi:hypothetical protein
MGVYENRIQDKMSSRHLNWNTDFVAALAAAEGISGASEASLSKSFRNLKELDSTRTAMPLDLLLGRFIKMSEAFEPFELQFNDPAKALGLLKDYESGALVVSINRQEPGALIYSVYVIENLIERNKMFEGIQNNQPNWGTKGTPIKDRVIANAAVKVLEDLGYPSHALSIHMRTTEQKIAKTLLNLGFVFEERDNQNVAGS